MTRLRPSSWTACASSGAPARCFPESRCPCRVGRSSACSDPAAGARPLCCARSSGVQVVAGGTVTVLGEPAGSPGLRSRVGYVTQDPSVYGDLTVRANLTYFAALVGAPRDAVERTIEAVDLTADADSRVDRLSGGQRSRVSLGAALVGSPELLVLDEPTVGLDPVLRRDLWAMFHRLAGDGTTLLVSSHVMDEATRCDRLLLLREGRLLADDIPGRFARPHRGPGRRTRLPRPDRERRWRHEPPAHPRDRAAGAAAGPRRPPHPGSADRGAVRADRPAGLDLQRHPGV